MSNLFKFLYIFMVLFIATSCVTFKKLAVERIMQRATDTVSSEVNYTPPFSPYVKKEKTSLDALWVNTKNKSSISYFSKCSNENSYLSLKDMEHDVLSHVNSSRIIKREVRKKHRYSVIRTLKYQTINGTYTVKPNSCFFIFNLVSPSLEIFKKEEVTFKKFIKGFKFL